MLANGTRTDAYFNQQWQVLEERTQHGSSAAIDDYVWDPSYIDAPLVRFHDGNANGDLNDAGVDNIRYYAWDANHNITATLTGAVLQHFVYDAYGKTLAYSSTWTNPAASTESGPLYGGYIFDAETDNYLARNRYYSVTLTTWISRDPIDYKGGMNLYAYVNDNPTYRLDPSGL
jgi:RHS repeat-associated protein